MPSCPCSLHILTSPGHRPSPQIQSGPLPGWMRASILAGWPPAWACGVAHPHGSSSAGPGPGTLCASLCPHQFPPAEPRCGGSSGAQLRSSVPWRVCLPPRWLGAEPWLSSSVEFVEKGRERLHLLPNASVDTSGWLLGPSPSGRGEALSLCLRDGGRKRNWQGSATH